MSLIKKPARRIRKRTASELQAHEESFQLLMARFDRVDNDNEAIKSSLSTHIKDDLEVKTVVDRHSTYWGLLIGLGTPVVLGLLAWFQGLFK